MKIRKLNKFSYHFFSDGTQRNATQQIKLFDLIIENFIKYKIK